MVQHTLSIPPASVAEIQPAKVTMDEGNGLTWVLTPKAGDQDAWLEQTVSFSGAVPYNSDKTTQTAYNKGFGKYIGVYQDGQFAPGNSVVGIESATRVTRRGGAASTSVTFLAVLHEMDMDSALTAAKQQNQQALTAAIQSIINAEPAYSSVRPAAVVAMEAAHLSQRLATSTQAKESCTGLSAEEIAGIVIGSIVGLVIYTAFVCWLCKKSMTKDVPFASLPLESPTSTPEKYKNGAADEAPMEEEFEMKDASTMSPLPLRDTSEWQRRHLSASCKLEMEIAEIRALNCPLKKGQDQYIHETVQV